MEPIDVDQLEERLARGATLVDVREPDEYASGHVPGALSVPMRQLPTRTAELDRDRPVYLICASGNRSEAMADLLVASGFEAQNVTGGTKAWIDSGRPVEGGDR